MKKMLLPAIVVSLIFGYLVMTRLSSASASTHPFDAEQAWQELVTVLKSDYAYLDHTVKAEALIAEFEHKALQTQTRKAFIDVAQAFARNFRDPHLNVGPYDLEDYSVYPTGSDIYAEYADAELLVVDVKSASAAFDAGIRPGMRIEKIDGLSPTETLVQVLGREAERLSPEQKNYGLNVALGGKRYQPRELQIRDGVETKTLTLPAGYAAIDELKKQPPVDYKRLDDIGYIRFNNSLGNNDTVALFEQALADLKDTRGLIIDLRNTPSGGNTGVAEPMLGHFVTAESSYQLYRTQSSDIPYKKAELHHARVTPQLPRVKQPFVVLAGRWTGSMGEGMTIGLDALGATAVIGAPMADLLGGIKHVELAKSQAWIEVGFERLYQVNGRFREDYVPSLRLEAADTDPRGEDPALTSALTLLRDTTGSTTAQTE